LLPPVELWLKVFVQKLVKLLPLIASLFAGVIVKILGSMQRFLNIAITELYSSDVSVEVAECLIS